MLPFCSVSLMKIECEACNNDVLFCSNKDENDDCDACERALAELENIDDEADEHDIAFVKIDDDQLVEDYDFDKDDLPKLIYFRNGIPLMYTG